MRTRMMMRLRTQMMKLAVAGGNDQPVDHPKEKVVLKMIRIKSTIPSYEKSVVARLALIPRWKRGSRLS